MLSDISIEPFRGDLEGLRSMAHSSWRDEYGIDSFPDLYRQEFLRFLFDRVDDRRLLMAAYKGDAIVAFLANLPQRMHFQGKVYRTVYSALLVTRREYLRKGLASAVIAEGLKLNRELAYDFALLTLETGHRSSQLIQKLSEAGAPVEHIKKISVLGRILDLSRVAYSEDLKSWERAAIRVWGAHRSPQPYPEIVLREYQTDDCGACLGLLNGYQESADLARVWEKRELAQELAYPDVSQTLVAEEEGRVKGLINFIYHEHLGRSTERWAWINHVAYPDLNDRMRRHFVEAFLAYIQEAGCVGAVEWRRDYYDLKPLFRARFFPYFRSVNLVAWIFNPEVSLKNLRRIYQVQI